MKTRPIDAPAPEEPSIDVVFARIGAPVSDVRYSKDHIVYSQGDQADNVFYLRSGRAKVLMVSEEGKGAVVGILQPGSFFGEECLVGHDLRLNTIRALSECACMRLDRAAFIRALRDDHRFSQLFAFYLVERHVRMQEDLADHLLHSTEKRLARLLLTLANYGKEDRPGPIIPKINQETLAEMIGTSRTHVNFFMNKFRQLGYIEYNGEIRVNRSLLNLLLHERPPVDPQD
jgi:CRP-like cAMP-binding protein